MAYLFLIPSSQRNDWHIGCMILTHTNSIPTITPLPVEMTVLALALQPVTLLIIIHMFMYV